MSPGEVAAASAGERGAHGGSAGAAFVEAPPPLPLRPAGAAGAPSEEGKGRAGAEAGPLLFPPGVDMDRFLSSLHSD